MFFKSDLNNLSTKILSKLCISKDPEVNSHPISIICISIKTEFYVVLLYNFKIIFYDKHFENIQAKHTTELISFEIQSFDRIFVDKLFKSDLKNMLQKVISK
jgi:hypothetical protein